MIIKFFLHLLLLCNLNQSYQFSNTNLIINKRPVAYTNNLLMVENICPEYLEKFMAEFTAKARAEKEALVPYEKAKGYRF